MPKTRFTAMGRPLVQIKMFWFYAFAKQSNIFSNHCCHLFAIMRILITLKTVLQMEATTVTLRCVHLQNYLSHFLGMEIKCSSPEGSQRVTTS